MFYHSIGKQNQCCAVTLAQHKIAQDRGKIRTVIQFADFAVTGKRHALAAVQQYISRRVRFLLELLYIQLIAPTENLPIDEFQFIAGMIFPVVTVFDAETMKRTRMQTGKKTLYCTAGN
jgi:hypothetical protein